MEEWASFSLTHVEYPKGDVLGKILAIFSLLPLAILCGFTTLVIFRRDLHTITFLTGQLLNEGLNMMLKKLIREPRPMSRSTNYTEWGMPSSHSQFMAFFSLYSLLFLAYRVPAMKTLHKGALSLLLIGIAGIVMVSRVYLLYHTQGQVGWGAAVGLIFSIVWFLFTQHLLTPMFPTITTWGICEWLLIKDTTLIPNILWFEYKNARQEARTRRARISTKSNN